MDLSQQELPLTAYFTRGSKESASRIAARKKSRDKPIEETPRSVARPLKRKRSHTVRCSPASTQGGQFASHATTLQLPTPAASTRKRVRGGVIGDLPSNPQLTPADADHNTVCSTGTGLVQLEFGPTSPKAQSSRNAGDTVTRLPGVSLATPSTSWRKIARPIGLEFLPGHNHAEGGVATPRTSSQRTPEPIHRVDRAPLTRPNLPPKLKNSVSLPRDGASELPSNAMDDQCLNDIPMFPVPSSQSQYLLHIDATPKRKQRFRHPEHVISSQALEEIELTLSSSLKPIAIGLPTGNSLRKQTPHRGPQAPRRRQSQQARALDSSPVRSPINADPSYPFAKKATDLFSTECISPSRRTPTGHRTRTPRKLVSHDSIENISPAQMEDSVTESESDSDLRQVLCHLPVFGDARSPIHRKPAQGNISSTEDDSVTEAESDTEILRCLAEIGKKRPTERRSEPREDTLPIISPLVSPARSRIATTFPIVGPGGSSIETNVPLHPSTREQCSDSLPSAVREFIRMFPGDESYPADFPESLRV